MRSRAILPVLFAAALLAPAGCGRPGERELQAGQRALQRGQHVRAKTYLERALTRPLGRAESARARNLLGLACWHLGEAGQAAEAFKESQRQDPDLLDPIYNLGVTLYRQGDALRASALFEEAALAAPADPRPLEFLGAILAEQGQWAAARGVLEDAVRRAPESARAATALAAAELHTRGAPAAVLRLMRALEKDAGYAPALYNLFAIHDRWMNDPLQARPYGERFLEAAGRSVRADEVSARLRAAAVGSGGAETAVRRPASGPAAPPAPPPEPPRDTPERLLEQARARGRQGVPEAALALCLRAARLAASGGDAAARERAFQEARRVAPALPAAALAFGAYRAGQDRWPEALDAFKDAVRLAPDDPEALRRLAEAAQRAGEHDTALVALRRLTRQAPGDAEAWWSLARLYDETLDLPAEAAAVYRTFTERFAVDTRAADARERLAGLAPEGGAPDDASASPPAREVIWSGESRRDRQAAIEAFNRGTDHQQRGDLDRAIYFYKRAVELDNRFATALFNLATVYRDRGELDLARSAYAKVLEMNPGSTEARYNLAILLHGAGDREGAVAQLREALGRAPEYAPAHYLLGLVYAEDEGTRQRARPSFERFVGLAPSDPLAGSVRAWLRENP